MLFDIGDKVKSTLLSAMQCSGPSWAAGAKVKKFGTDHKLARQIPSHANETLTRGLIRKLLSKSGHAKLMSGKFLRLRQTFHVWVGLPLSGSMVERCGMLYHFLHPVVSVSGSVLWLKYGNCRFVLVPCYVDPS